MICIATAITIPSAPAFAKESDDNTCAKGSGDVQISACTKYLSRPKLTAQQRANAHHFRARGYSGKLDHDRAIRDLNEAIKLGSKSAYAYTDRCSAYLNKRQFDRALEDANEALRIDPKNAVAFLMRGTVYFVRYDFDRSIEDLSEAIRLDPKLSAAYSARGAAFGRKHNFDRALEDANEALRIDPKSSFGFAARGGLHLRKREYDRAIEDYGDALRLASTNTDALAGRGLAYARKGQHDRAIEDLNRSIQLSPQIPYAYGFRGYAFGRKGDFVRAMADLDKSVEMDPKYSMGRSLRGLIHEAKGDLEPALADFRAALAGDPREQDALEGVKRIQQAIAARPGAPSAASAAPAVASAAPVAVPLAAPTLGIAERGPRVALVIGNGAYRHASVLPNPANDARDMAVALRELGFREVEGYDLDGTAMRAKIAEFGDSLPNAAVTLFFYAGHGVQVAGKNYLIPVDAKLERPSSLGVETVEIGTVLADMESEKRTNLVFLDACRDNPLTRSLARSFGGGSRSASVGQGLAQLNAGIGTLIAFATSPETVALDGGGRNSPFTTALLRHIRTPDLEIRTLLTRVRADVVRTTQEKQVPWDHSSLLGEFYFRTLAQK
jgi:tetratricopeptide (TPR) repeat protein